MKLPILAGTDDVIQVVQFLKTRATGCSIEDVKSVLDKKLLDPRKVNAYIAWKIISRDGNKLKLTELGKQLAKAPSTEHAEVFANVLFKISQYHSALEWMFYQKDITSVTNIEIATYWYENKKFGMDTETENTLKDMAICFFKLCEAATIGKFVLGRKGCATRLDIDRDNLGQYIGGSELSDVHLDDVECFDDKYPITETLTTIPLPEETQSAHLSVDYSEEPTCEPVRIFISHGKNMDIVDQIKTLIELANLEYEIAVEKETSAIPIPDKVFGAMRRCNSAVICVSADENDKKEDGEYVINQNVLIEIGSAFVLYDKRVILVWDKRLKIPSNLQGLYRCEFTGDDLSWSTGIKLMKALNEFKK